MIGRLDRKHENEIGEVTEDHQGGQQRSRTNRAAKGRHGERSWVGKRGEPPSAPGGVAPGCYSTSAMYENVRLILSAGYGFAADLDIRIDEVVQRLAVLLRQPG